MTAPSKNGNPPKQRKKPTLKMRIPSTRNPYGKIIEDTENWPPRNDMLKALSLGPTAIRNWQKEQIEELIVPHLSGQQIESIIEACGFSPSLLFGRIHKKLIFEFLHSTLSSINSENEQNKKKLVNILRSSLRFIRIHHFAELNVSILSRIDVLPKHILRILSDQKNQDLMLAFPINIKRQIWSFKQSLFDREFELLFNSYCDPSHFWAHTNLENIIKRANNETLKAMVNDIGSCSVLFNRCCALLAKQFKKNIAENGTNWPQLVFLSNFRIEISASLYDHAHRHLLEEFDPIWPIIFDFYYDEPTKQSLTTTQIEALHKKLFSVTTHTETAMFCCIPWIKWLLFNSFLVLLGDIANKRILPRDSKPLSLLCLILQSAICPKAQCPQTATAKMKVDHKVLFQFVPLLTVCVYVDSLSLNLDMPLNESIADLIKYANESALCSYLLIYYVLFCLSKKRTQRALQVMDIAMKSGFDSYWLAMNGLTEIHLLCHKIESADADSKQKQKMIAFAIAFIAQSKNQKNYQQLAEPIVALIQKLKIGGKECEEFMKKLK